MTADPDYDRKLDELDRLLNDPDGPMEPSRVWSLLAEISRRDGIMDSSPERQQVDAKPFE